MSCLKKQTDECYSCGQSARGGQVSEDINDPVLEGSLRSVRQTVVRPSPLGGN